MPTFKSLVLVLLAVGVVVIVVVSVLVVLDLGCTSLDENDGFRMPDFLLGPLLTVESRLLVVSFRVLRRACMGDNGDDDDH